MFQMNRPPLSSSSASQDTPAGSSTQKDLPPVLSFSRKRLRGRNGYRWSTEPRAPLLEDLQPTTSLHRVRPGRFSPVLSLEILMWIT